MTGKKGHQIRESIKAKEKVVKIDVNDTLKEIVTDNYTLLKKLAD